MKVFLTIIGGIALGLASVFSIVYGVGLVN